MALRLKIIDCSVRLNSLTLKGASASDIEKWDEESESFSQYKLTDEIKYWLRSVHNIYSRCWYPFDKLTGFKMFENPAYGKQDITEEDFFFVLQTIAKRIKSKYMKTPDKENVFLHGFEDYWLDSINLHTSDFSENRYLDMFVGSQTMLILQTISRIYSIIRDIKN